MSDKIVDAIYMVELYVLRCATADDLKNFDQLVGTFEGCTLDMATPLIYLVRVNDVESSQTVNSEFRLEFATQECSNKNYPDSMELMLGNIRMNKANTKAVSLETITLKRDMAYQLVFTKHIHSKAEVREDLLQDYDSPMMTHYREWQKSQVEVISGSEYSDVQSNVSQEILEPNKSKQIFQRSNSLILRQINVDDFRGELLAGMDKECSFIIKNIFKIRMNNKLGSLISSMNGLLLYGPPGTGKSLLASAIAKQWKSLEPELEVEYVKGPALFSKMVGETEKQLREVFSCPKNRNKLIVVDEIDSLFPSRSSGEQSALNNRVVSQFLSVMDGLEKVSNLFVVGTTNRKDSIDPAVLRNGRLGLHLQVTYQSKDSQNKILMFRMEQLMQNGYVDTKNLQLMLTEFNSVSMAFSGAEIMDIFNGCVVNIVDEDSKELSLDQFKSALKQVIDQKENKSQIIKYLLQQPLPVSMKPLKMFRDSESHNKAGYERLEEPIHDSSAVLGNDGSQLQQKNIMLGTVNRQFEIASQLLKENGNNFSQIQYSTPEKLLRIRSEDRVKELLEEIDNKIDGQQKLMIIANLDEFLSVFPECQQQMILVFKNLMLLQGPALLNLREENTSNEKTVIVLGMTEAFYQLHFSEYSDVCLIK